MSLEPDSASLDTAPLGRPISWGSLVVRVVVVVALALPAVAVRLGGVHLAPVTGMVVAGAGVLAAAVILMWAAETARADMSGTLALALLALIAVLPEYAVDLYYAWKAGSEPAYTAYAAANMTGANRLLVGVGWALVVLMFALGSRRASRRHHRRRRRLGRPRGPAVWRRHEVRLDERQRAELGFLALAAVIAFVPALLKEIGWYVAIILIGLYVAYIVHLARTPGGGVEEPTGVPARLVTLPRVRRRVVTWVGFAAGAAVVLASAEPFAEALVASGDALGIDEFLLVQWLAPLASEAPELIVAAVLAWRLRGADALGILLSSKVNQWTLLVGSLPLAYWAGGGGWSLPLDSRQTEEVLLTAAQTVLGLALLIDLTLRRSEAALLFLLFALQFALPDEHARLLLSWVYLAIGFTLLIQRNQDLGLAVRATAANPADPRTRSGPGGPGYGAGPGPRP